MSNQIDLFSEQASDAPRERGRDQRLVAAAGGVALVIGVGAFFLLSGGSSDSASNSPVIRTRSTTTNVVALKKTAPKPVAKAPAVVPAVATVNVGRNPFTALYVVPVVAPAAATAPTTPLTGTPGAAAPTTGGTTYIPPGSTAPLPTTPAVVLHKLALQTVSGGSGTSKTAGTFLIDKKKYVVPVGQVFGPTGELVVVAYQQDAKGGWTAVLRVGDSAPFDAAQGDNLNVM